MTRQQGLHNQIMTTRSPEGSRKAQLQIMKNGTVIHSGIYEIDDADGFGKVCSIAWSALRARQLAERPASAR